MSVTPAGVENWSIPPDVSASTCPHCGSDLARMRSTGQILPHTRKGDETLAKKRICFGRGTA